MYSESRVLEEGQGVRIGGHESLFKDNPSHFVEKLHSHKSFLKVAIICKVLEIAKERKVLEESLASQLVSDKFSEFRVALVKPTSRSDSIGDIGKLL